MSRLLLAMALLFSAHVHAETFRGYLVKKADGVYFSGVSANQTPIEIPLGTFAKTEVNQLQNCMKKKKSRVIEVETGTQFVQSMSPAPGKISIATEITIQKVQCVPGKLVIPLLASFGRPL